MQTLTEAVRKIASLCLALALLCCSWSPARADLSDEWWREGVSLVRQDKLSEAVKAFSELIRYSPDHKWALNNRGFTLLSLGMLAIDKGCVEEGRELIKRARLDFTVKLKSGDSNTPVGHLCGNRAWANLYLGDFPTAKEDGLIAIEEGRRQYLFLISLLKLIDLDREGASKDLDKVWEIFKQRGGLKLVSKTADRLVKLQMETIEDLVKQPGTLTLDSLKADLAGSMFAFLIPYLSGGGAPVTGQTIAQTSAIPAAAGTQPVATVEQVPETVQQTAALHSSGSQSQAGTTAVAQPAADSSAGSSATTAPARAFRPRLFVLSVGVSHYTRRDISLRYAAADATALAKALAEQPGAVFGEVRTKILTDEAVTRASIINQMQSFLGRAVSTDVVVIFIAGHGIRRAGSESFYFLPHPVTETNLTVEGLRWTDFIEEIGLLRARVKNLVLILDTCHAGALNVSMRSIKRAEDLSSPFHNQGVYVIAAARPGEEAQESGRWKHGVFTFALLEAIEGRADFNGDGAVDTTELFQYTERRVAELTDGRQHPHFRMTGGSLPLAAVR